MAQWRVYNTHPDGMTHKEMFKGNMLEIPAGKFILMDYEDAVQFRGQFFPIRMTNMGVQDPASYKCIQIKPDGDPEVAKKELHETVKVYVCHFDGHECASMEELNKYIEENHSDKIFKDDGLDEQLMKDNKAKKGAK